MSRLILHVDMDAFFASVEQLDHPEWRGRPVVVGAAPDQRGVVAAASYEARRFGIHSAMPSQEAGRRCPHAIFTPPRRERYEAMSQRVFEIFTRFTPWVEPLSIDEAFLDVSGSQGLWGDGPAIATEIRRCIRTETGLTASVGIARNKFLAKLASDLDKPDGTTVVPDQHDAMIAFLEPLPVEHIWGVGSVLQQRLNQAGMVTIGDLQRCHPATLEAMVGRHTARHLLQLAMGEDTREVSTEHEEKSISNEHTFNKDVLDAERLEKTLLGLVAKVGRRLREKQRYAGTVHLKLRWKNFKTITRQRKVDPPCCDDFSLRSLALSLLHNEGIHQAVRLIGFGVSDLKERPTEQLSLFSEPSEDLDKRERLSRTVDRLQQRFGKAAPRSPQAHEEEI